jgi:hypothetical protein
MMDLARFQNQKGSLLTEGSPFALAVALFYWSQLLSVIQYRIVFLASNHLTGNSKQHEATGINKRAE